jgi:hypothetical protein
VSDNDPNQQLNDKRLRVESTSMTLNIQRLELRLMEIEVEKAKVLENMDSSNKRIGEIKKLLGE